MYAELREMALKGRDGVVAGSYAIVMDMKVDADFASLIAVDDGSVSVYWSTGGGVIGAGQQYAEIAKAGRGILAELAREAPLLKQQGVFTPAGTFPLPDNAHLCFYLRTPDGVLAAHPRIAELERGDHALSDLNAAMQVLLHQVMEKPRG